MRKVGERMILEVVRFDGGGGRFKVKDFEFRANQVANWLRLWIEDSDAEITMYGVSVVRLVERRQTKEE